jgi:hypothetical protein
LTAAVWRAALSESFRSAGWAPALVFAAHAVASLGFGAYERFPPLDIPMHLLGGIAISFFLGRLYRAAERLGLLGRPARSMYVVVIPALATAAAVLWEFAEFASDRVFRTRAQLGLEDTLLDMLLGCVGSVVYVALSASPRGGAPPHPAFDLMGKRVPFRGKADPGED